MATLGRAASVALAATALALGGAVLGPSEAAAAADDEQGRPWARGTLRPSVGFGFGYSSDLVTLGFGVGASYFLANGFSLGLQLDDQVLLYSSRLKNEFSGIERQIPTNIFRMTPVAQWVFFRHPRFSPYVFAGVGPAFFNNDNGVFGQWTAGPGAYIGISGPVYLDIGVGFSGMFPTDKCNKAFDYKPTTGPAITVLDHCSFRWGPRIGIVLSFGGRSKQRRERPREPSPRFEEPPEPLPAPAPVVEPDPEPSEEPPVDAPGDPGDAPPPTGPPPQSEPVAEPDPEATPEAAPDTPATPPEPTVVDPAAAEVGAATLDPVGG